MRVLAYFGESHRAYGQAIARAIGCSRPHLDVSVAGTGKFASEVLRLRPEVVISDRPKGKACAKTFVELSGDPGSVSRIRVGGRYRRSRNPSFAELLGVVDETESLRD